MRYRQVLEWRGHLPDPFFYMGGIPRTAKSETYAKS
ncbi:hypothetical protein ARTHRO9V_160219 [Arthrobacter sp. 9V]|nr:hypothetical protein ARTHRO9V_160219 [Arthrobacter sp. 9V]